MLTVLPSARIWTFSVCCFIALYSIPWIATSWELAVRTARRLPQHPAVVDVWRLTRALRHNGSACPLLLAPCRSVVASLGTRSGRAGHYVRRPSCIGVRSRTETSRSPTDLSRLPTTRDNVDMTSHSPLISTYSPVNTTSYPVELNRDTDRQTTQHIGDLDQKQTDAVQKLKYSLI